VEEYRSEDRTITAVLRTRPTSKTTGDKKISRRMLRKMPTEEKM